MKCDGIQGMYGIYPSAGSTRCKVTSKVSTSIHIGDDVVLMPNEQTQVDGEDATQATPFVPHSAENWHGLIEDLPDQAIDQL